jgi:transcriptional regulator with XRE-family HTH domain
MADHYERGSLVNSQEKQFFKAFGARISEARKAQGLTQQQLADNLGVAQQTYADYEAGITRVPASSLLILEEVLGLTPDEMLGRDGRGKPKPGPASKLDRQIERIRQLPRATQKVVMNMLDGIIAQADH